MTLNFIFQANSSGKHSVFARISHKSKIKKVPTGYVVDNYDPKHWKKYKEIPGNDPVNSLVREWRKKFSQYVMHCDENQLLATVEKAADVVCKKEKLKDFMLTDAIAAYVKFKTGATGNKESTNDRYRSLQKRVEEYEEASGSVIYLEAMDQMLFHDLTNHWVSVDKNGNDAIKKKLSDIKTVLHYAVGKMIKHFPNLEKVKLDVPETNRQSITDDEYFFLKEYKAHSIEAQTSLDAFLFACETGLRISDIVNIAPSSLFTSEGDVFVKFVMDKVINKTPTVPLSDFAQQLLAKYKTDDKTPYFDTLPTGRKKNGTVTAQAVNRMLKTVFEKAELNRIIEDVKISGKKVIVTKMPLYKKVHLHMGRHSAATLLLEQGIAPTDLQKFLHHSKLATTEKYLHVKEKVAFTGIRAALNRNENKLKAV